MASDLITLANAERNTLAQLLEGHPALTPDRMIQLLMSATKTSYYLRLVADPKTGHPETLIAALLQAAAVGLEPNTPHHHCALIPRKANDGKWTANFQLEYRGRMHLGVLHGGLADWRAVLVYKQDEFEERPASSRDPIHHRPARNIAKTDADMVGAYSLVFLSNGIVKSHYMERDEIEKIRDRYSDSWKAYKKDKTKDDTPWLQRPGEMWLKTVVNNHYKQIVLTSPSPAIVDGQVWERGPAAAVRIPDEEPEDAELSEEDTPRARGDTNVQLHQSETAASKPASSVPVGNEAQASEKESNSKGDAVRAEPRVHTVLEAMEEVEGDRYVDADQARKIEDWFFQQIRKPAFQERQQRDPMLVVNLLKSFGIGEFRELKVSQLDEFKAAIEGR